MDDFRPHLPLPDGHLPGQANVVAQLRAFVQGREAFSDNTWRQLLSVMRICAGWAIEHGRTFLPMARGSLRDYLLWLQSKRACIIDNRYILGTDQYVTPSRGAHCPRYLTIDFQSGPRRWSARYDLPDLLNA